MDSLLKLLLLLLLLSALHALFKNATRVMESTSKLMEIRVWVLDNNNWKFSQLLLSPLMAQRTIKLNTQMTLMMLGNNWFKTFVKDLIQFPSNHPKLELLIWEDQPIHSNQEGLLHKSQASSLPQLAAHMVIRLPALNSVPLFRTYKPPNHR